MGYTHYFQQNTAVTDEQWENFEKDAIVVIDHIQKNLNIVLTSDDESGVIVNNKRINLNGDSSANLNHETFYLTKNYEQFNFCKTAQKPYDLAVCSLLLLAYHHMKNHHDIGSDGNFEDWQDAMKLNAQLFSYAFTLPERIDSSNKVSEYENILSNEYCKEDNTTIENGKYKKTRFNF